MTVHQETLEPKEIRVQLATSLVAIKENQETPERMVCQEPPEPRVLKEILVTMEMKVHQVFQECLDRKELRGTLDHRDLLDQKGIRVTQGSPVRTDQMVMTEQMEQKEKLELRDKKEKMVLAFLVSRENLATKARMVRKEKLACPAHLD